ncbi:hypothetical protein EJ02DRAFT_432805 [Clathrospora elynae]|uniref:C2H2-type domain-containing protein n=1 Tax=Clathrospora elynae TaxID=706981 RepID=A0A6A5STT8_9PLEO|nr:hypothetical protein EJ02DRAFT_432805 [Clathrospora elynae]
MAILQRKRLNISLTFKVLQFLRRLTKPRVLEGSIDESHLGAKTSPSLRSISNGLSRISIQDAKKPRVAHRICKNRQHPRSSRSSRRVQTPGSVTPASRNLAVDEVQHMLRSIDNKLSRPAGSAFSSIASNNKLFLKHNSAPIFEGCSLNETVQLLVAVHDAINILTECRLQYGDDWLVAQGLDAGLIIDDNFIANYEHMLLRLQTELTKALARKALEELLRGGHDKKQHKLLSWFTEFAEKPQSLSTSFPWTIKPSLAVLWGVCWMFYDRPPDEQPAKGGVRLDRILQNLGFQWEAPASSDYINLGRELIGHEEPEHLTQQTANAFGLEHDMFHTEQWQSDGVRQAVADGPRAEAPQPYPNNTYYRSAAQQLPIFSPNNFYLPRHQGTTAAPLTAFPQFGSDQNSWQYTSSPSPQNSHLIISGQNPTIRVTAAESVFFAQPQPDFASSDTYPPGRQPEASPLNPNIYFDYNTNPQYIMASTLPPDTTTIQVPQVSRKHERTVSVNSNTDMPTPVSIGQRSPLLSPTSGEQTHMISSPHRNTHSRGISIDSSQDGDEEGSRRNYSYKRAEEPPRTTDGKIHCKYQECHSLYFDRKCEWSKHMDKHDRPYKCIVKGCEKLQGFTYSGGLLRHEREVHKMHGGTKKSLFCPFADCKRSSGAGFTRKENLAEHVRRVHRRTSMSADMHGLVIRRDTTMTMERSPVVKSRSLASESPFNSAMEFRDEDDASLKRKRGGSDSGISDRGHEDMRAEIKRLRLENEEKNERLRELERAVTALQQSHR